MLTGPLIWLHCPYCPYETTQWAALAWHTHTIHARASAPPTDDDLSEYGHPGEIANDLAELERT